MKIGLLTSSRSDYGLYKPLIKKLIFNKELNLKIIAFGTHFSEKYGYTYDQIKNDGVNVDFKLKTYVPSETTKTETNKSMQDVFKMFSEFWKDNNFDFVYVLGDRYEMYMAVLAGLVYNVKYGHISGGEETFGAIDNVFRHSISIQSKLNFCSTEIYKNRLTEILGTNEFIFNSGALSVDSLSQTKILNKSELNQLTGLDFTEKIILCTFHPETYNNRNEFYINEICNAFRHLNEYQILFTMPNADPGSDVIRNVIYKFSKENKKRIKIFENLGNKAYLSAMKYCSMMVGNTSSGFVEASFFSKKVINLGDRQQGRIITKNIINCEINSEQIIKKVYSKIADLRTLESIYGNGNASSLIINKTLKYLKNI